MKMPSRPHSKSSRFFYGVVAYCSGAVLALAVTEYTYEHTLALYWQTVLIGCAPGLAAVGGLYVLRRRLAPRSAVSATLQVMWVLLPALAILNILLNKIELKGYGDKVVMIALFDAGRMLPRWLIGMVLLKWLHAATWASPVLQDLLPIRLITTEIFLELAATVVMGLATLALLRKWPGKLAMVFPTLVPLWFVLATGYVEYYPFIAWVLAAVLGYLFLSPTKLAARSPYQIGILTGTLPLVYVAFAPISALVFLFYVLVKPRNMVRTLLTALLSSIVLIRIFHTESVDVFLYNLYESMRFSDEWTYRRYIGQASAEGSNFFCVPYAFSREHLRDILFMYSFGGGVFFPLIFIAGLALTPFKSAGALGHAFRSSTFWLGAALIFWHVFYMLFYIPRLGPYIDIDLFFSTFIVVAFFAGWLLDRLLAQGALPEETVLPVTAFLLGGAGPMVAYISVVGIGHVVY